MMKVPLGLNDAFTEEGFFWLEGNDDNEVGGTLSFDPTEGAILKLLGLLEDIGSSFVKRPDKPIIIFGVTKKGKRVTLLRCLNRQRQINMPGIPNETWFSNLLVVGIHLRNESEDKIFSKSYFRFDSIEQWLGHSAFTYEFDNDDKILTVKAQRPRESHFASHKEFRVTSVGGLYTDNKPLTRFTIDVISHLSIEPETAQSLTWHISTAVRIQELAALCMGHYLPLTSLELRAPSEGTHGDLSRPTEVHLYTKMIHPEAGSRPSNEPPLVSGPELLAFNSEALQAWFDQHEVFEPAIDLFFTVSGQKKLFTNIRLLLAIQALEVFHRRTTEETVMPISEFAQFAQVLVESVPPSASAEMREKLAGMYQFANEPSLNQRLKSIVVQLAEELGSPIPCFNKSYIRKLVDTRNYYTHFSSILENKILDGGGMHWASRRIVLLLTILFLRRLGISIRDIVVLLERHREFSRLWLDTEIPVW